MITNVSMFKFQMYRTAQSISFPDSSSVCSEQVSDFIDDMSKAIGCPLEYVLVPLLPCIAGKTH